MASRSSVCSGSKRDDEDEEEEEDGIEGHYSYHGLKERDEYCVLPRDAILSFARDLIVNHRMDEAKRLLPNFLADKQNPQMFMFKFTMLVFDCFQDNDFRSHYNKFLLPFFTKCIAFDIDKRDLYLELISLMVRYGQFWEAREFLADQSRKVSWRTHRSNIVSMEGLYKCYSSYLEYWSWYRTKHLADTKSKAIMIYSSVEKYLLQEEQTSLDFMAFCVADIFKYYNDIDGAIQFYSQYAEKHENNLSAQLLLFHLLQLQQIDDDSKESLNLSLRLKSYYRISCLDPANPVIASVSSSVPETQQEVLVSLSDSVQHLMSYLDYGRNKYDINSWNVLVQHVKNLLKYNRKDFDQVKEDYIENYHDYWQYYHFTSVNLEKGLEKPKVLFCCMMDVCPQFIEQVFILFKSTDFGLELKQETEELVKLRAN